MPWRDGLKIANKPLLNNTERVSQWGLNTGEQCCVSESSAAQLPNRFDGFPIVRNSLLVH